MSRAAEALAPRAGPRKAAESRSIGAALAVATSAFISAQDPLSGPAARKLGAVEFVLVTEIALAVATPFLLIEREARRDFVRLLSSPRNIARLFALMVVGLCGLAMYNLGLRHAHPVVITAILNLAPFWAALVARFVAGVRIPAGGLGFAAALVVGFVGATLVAYSQLTPEESSGKSFAQILGQGSWYFAIPVPVFTSLSGTLVGLWFKDFREQASIAAAILAPAAALIPGCALYLMFFAPTLKFDLAAAALLTAGAISASVIGRLTYQVALSKTGGDNGFVTMFFLLGPGLSALYSWLLSFEITSLRFHANTAYFAGLVITACALFVFGRRARGA